MYKKLLTIARVGSFCGLSCQEFISVAFYDARFLNKQHFIVLHPINIVIISGNFFGDFFREVFLD